MDLMRWSLCSLCPEVIDKPLNSTGNSKDVKQISKIYTNTATLLKQFQTAERLPKNFHPSFSHLVIQLAFKDKKMKRRYNAHISETNLLKTVLNN